MFLFAQVAAWRFGIDAKGRGQLNFNEFCTAVRRALPAPSWSYTCFVSLDQQCTFLIFQHLNSMLIITMCTYYTVYQDILHIRIYRVNVM